MNDATQADIRIIDATTEGSVIHVPAGIEVKSYEDEIFIFGDDRRFVVNDAQLNTLNETHEIATDF